ncbi:MAG: cell surface protein [Opitutales bacterium]
MEQKFITWGVLLLCVGLLGGCNTRLNNLTSERVPQNPSGIYRLTMSASVPDASVLDDSLEAFVVIDGNRFSMTRSETGEKVFFYDYVMPPERNSALYYYILNYQVDRLAGNRDRTIQDPKKGEPYQLLLTNKYVVTLQSSRGPVGATIPVLGAGFAPGDVIVVGGYEAQTRYDSPNAIAFVVPPLQAEREYEVQWHSADTVIPVGRFLVDPSRFFITPETLAIAPGERTTLVIGLDNAAPAGGLPVNVTTDVPNSVIMPPVNIPPGQRTVSIVIEGGRAGSGTLFFEAPGFAERQVPITVGAGGGVSATTSGAADL